MTFVAEQLELEELQLRHEKCRELLKKYAPKAQGLLVFSRTNVYYLTGSRANGMLWLPLEGNAVLLVRKGEDRCRLESPIDCIATFKSYSNIPDICANFDAPLGNVIAAEKQALPWSLAQMLKDRLKQIEFTHCDEILNEARFIKTDFELKLLYEANTLHLKALMALDSGEKNIPQNVEVSLDCFAKKLSVGMTEREIAHNIWHSFFAHNHGGALRVHRPWQETFLGKISVGESAFYPAPYSKNHSCMGLVGEHPSMPFMGNSGKVWTKGKILLADTGFIFKGYHSASTLTYFAGNVQNLDSKVRNAYACCFEILHSLQENFARTQNIQICTQMAFELAVKKGFADTFMGLEHFKSLVLGQSLGLAFDEATVMTLQGFKPKYELKPRVVFSVNPMIAIEGVGIVGLRHSFEVNADGALKAFHGLEQKHEIICIE